MAAASAISLQLWTEDSIANVLTGVNTAHNASALGEIVARVSAGTTQCDVALAKNAIR